MSNYIRENDNCQEVGQHNAKLKQPRKQLQPEKVLPEEWLGVYESVESPLVRRVTYYKWRNVKMCAALRSIGERNRANLINECGTYLRVGRRNGHDVFNHANFCRERMCAVCGWRRSAKFVAQMLPVVQLLNGQGFKFVFLTLTVPNCIDSDVSETVSEILKGWDRLNKRKSYKSKWLGFCRSIEVTYNSEKDTYHPHIHALLAVKSEYFREVEKADDERPGPKKMNLLELSIAADWKTVLKNPVYENLPYPLQVSIIPANRARNSCSKTEVSAAAAVETLKYAFKVNHKDISNRTISALFYGLQGRRLISFGGVVAKAREKLQQPDIDEAMMEFDGEEAKDQEAVPEVLYIFNMKGWSIIE